MYLPMIQSPFGPLFVFAVCVCVLHVGSGNVFDTREKPSDVQAESCTRKLYSKISNLLREFKCVYPVSGDPRMHPSCGSGTALPFNWTLASITRPAEFHFKQKRGFTKGKIASTTSYTADIASVDHCHCCLAFTCLRHGFE